MKYFPNVLLAILLSLFGASFLGVLFVSGNAWLLGGVAFVLMALVAFMHKGFKGHTIAFFKLWCVIFPCFICFFLIAVLLSPKQGAPDIGHLPVLAARPHYNFSKGVEVSRARFAVVATSFYLAWHSFSVGIALEQWARLKKILSK